MSTDRDAHPITCWQCHGSGVVADENKRCVRCPLCRDGRLEVVPAAERDRLAEALREIHERDPYADAAGVIAWQIAARALRGEEKP